MEIVLKRHPDSHLHIIGDGVLKKELIQKSFDLGLERNITFHGALEHSLLPKFFAKSLMLVVPSININNDFEGMPTVLPEAMAARIPIVTTDAGGITDIIENYKTGIIVQQKNYEQLSEKIVELIENNNLRNQLTQNAYEKIINNFTWEKIGEKFKKLIYESTN